MNDQIIDIQRIRSFVRAQGKSDLQRARKLGVNWSTIRSVLDPDRDPKLSTLMKIAAQIPPGFDLGSEGSS